MRSGGALVLSGIRRKDLRIARMCEDRGGEDTLGPRELTQC